MQPNLAPLLNEEIRALAKRENKTDEKQMEALMDELAALCGVKRRHLYHWRSGHYRLPAEHVPNLCKRFGSLALMHELNRAAAETEIEVLDGFDLALRASIAVREDMAAYELLLLSFETDGIQPGEMAELRELGARAHRNLDQLLDIAEADCAHRLAAPPQRKGNVPYNPREKATEQTHSAISKRSLGGVSK